jgi:hypothetical protein
MLWARSPDRRRRPPRGGSSISRRLLSSAPASVICLQSSPPPPRGLPPLGPVVAVFGFSFILVFSKGKCKLDESYCQAAAQEGFFA